MESNIDAIKKCYSAGKSIELIISIVCQIFCTWIIIQSMQVIGDNILQGRTQRLDRLNNILKAKQPQNSHSTVSVSCANATWQTREIVQDFMLYPSNSLAKNLSKTFWAW